MNLFSAKSLSTTTTTTITTTTNYYYYYNLSDRTQSQYYAFQNLEYKFILHTYCGKIQGSKFNIKIKMNTGPVYKPSWRGKTRTTLKVPLLDTKISAKRWKKSRIQFQSISLKVFTHYKRNSSKFTMEKSGNSIFK